MIRPPQVPDEQDRLRDLHRLRLLDTDPEPHFDRIVKLASGLLRSPVSLISLVDESRQWFKARVGLEARETPREWSFCAHALANSDPLIVPDARLDDRFHDNPLVTGDPNIRFYAGAPLKRPGGSAFGTLCVLDTEPREHFSPEETALLVELASIVTEQMERRALEVLHLDQLLAAEQLASLRNRFHEALQASQTRFMGGGAPEEVFGRLLKDVAQYTGSRAGCLAEVEPASGTLCLITVEGDCDLRVAMNASAVSGEVVSGSSAPFEDWIVLPCRHGGKIAGMLGLAQGDHSLLKPVITDLEPFLRGLGGLFDAARSRRQGRKDVETIRLRERALSSINSAVSIVDPRRGAGEIIYCNSAFERMAGYTSAELAGRNLSILYGPETSHESAAQVQQALSGGSALEILIRNYHREGRAYWSRLRLSPVPGANGEVEYFVTVADDVTEEIELQTELRRARDLAEANAQAQARFMANMSHEIRTPMNAVVGMTSLLLDTDLTVEQREFTETIRAGGEGLLTIINEILDFSRIDSGSLEIEHVEFDLRECVESALDLIAATAAHKAIEVAYLFDPAIPAVITGDVTRVRQMLINLLGNAVKFTAEGSVELSVSGSPREGGRRGEDWELHFAVRDTGVGIPAHKLEDIFRPFQQADNSSTRRFGGTGLGLAIAKHLAELMGGTIRVESELGKGSVFHFTMLAQAVGALTAGDIGAGHSGLDGKRALVLDPNATSRSILLQHLSSWKMETTAFVSVSEASAVMAQAPREQRDFDVAVVDNDLADLSAETAAQICGEAPVLLLCSLGRRNHGLAATPEALNRRVVLHSKPVKPSQLCDSLVGLFAGQSIRVPVITPANAFDPRLAELHPRRILLVEDNPVNQKLALLLMSRFGYRADTANNGLEALRAVRRQRYDLIFMDMHMPEMDGIAASREIRQSDSDPSHRPWIVALTANAMENDRKLCMAAGMDDFVSKPIEAQDLRRAILASPERVSPAPPPAGDLDLPDYLAEMVAEDPDFVADTIQLFLDDAMASLDELDAALSVSDARRVSQILHGLKGSSASLGAGGFAHLCGELEPQVLAGDLTGCAAAVAELRAAFRASASLLRAVVPAESRAARAGSRL